MHVHVFVMIQDSWWEKVENIMILINIDKFKRQINSINNKWDMLDVW